MARTEEHRTSGAGAVAGAAVAVVLLNTAAMLGLSELLDSVTLDGPVAGLLLAATLGVVNGGALIVFSRVDLPLTTLGLGLFLLGINIAAILVGGFLLPGASKVALIGALYMAIVGGATVALLVWSLHSDTEDQPGGP